MAFKVKSETDTTNDNSLQDDAESRQLALLIDGHERARQVVVQLTAIHAYYKSTRVSSRLLSKHLHEARRKEQVARDALLLCPVGNVQQAASKAVHLRNVLAQDEAASVVRLTANRTDEHICCIKRIRP
jgi:hypothetical protein